MTDCMLRPSSPINRVPLPYFVDFGSLTSNNTSNKLQKTMLHQNTALKQQYTTPTLIKRNPTRNSLHHLVSSSAETWRIRWRRQQALKMGES